MTIIKTDKGTIKANNGTCKKDCGFMMVWDPEGFHPQHVCLLGGVTLKKTRRAYARCEACIAVETEYNMMANGDIHNQVLSPSEGIN